MATRANSPGAKPPSPALPPSPGAPSTSASTTPTSSPSTVQLDKSFDFSKAVLSPTAPQMDVFAQRQADRAQHRLIGRSILPVGVHTLKERRSGTVDQLERGDLTRADFSKPTRAVYDFFCNKTAVFLKMSGTGSFMDSGQALNLSKKFNIPVLKTIGLGIDTFFAGLAIGATGLTSLASTPARGFFRNYMKTGLIALAAINFVLAGTIRLIGAVVSNAVQLGLGVVGLVLGGIALGVYKFCTKVCAPIHNYLKKHLYDPYLIPALKGTLRNVIVPAGMITYLAAKGLVKTFVVAPVAGVATTLLNTIGAQAVPKFVNKHISRATQYLSQKLHLKALFEDTDAGKPGYVRKGMQDFYNSATTGIDRASRASGVIAAGLTGAALAVPDIAIGIIGSIGTNLISAFFPHVVGGITGRFGTHFSRKAELREAKRDLENLEDKKVTFEFMRRPTEKLAPRIADARLRVAKAERECGRGLASYFVEPASVRQALATFHHGSYRDQLVKKLDPRYFNVETLASRLEAGRALFTTNGIGKRKRKLVRAERRVESFGRAERASDDELRLARVRGDSMDSSDDEDLGSMYFANRAAEQLLHSPPSPRARFRVGRRGRLPHHSLTVSTSAPTSDGRGGFGSFSSRSPMLGATSTPSPVVTANARDNLFDDDE